MVAQRQQKVDVEQELQAFGDALRQTQTCPPTEIVQHYNQALYHLKRITDCMVKDTLQRLYEHNKSQIEATGERYEGEMDELRRKQPGLEQSWRERLKYTIGQ